MKRTLRSATRAVYNHAVKPLLFTLHPDDVHRGLITVAKTIERIPLIRQLPSIWAYRSPGLEQEVLGMHVRNPIGLSAGFDKNVELARTMKRVGFGFMTGGSVTADECAGNPKPWFHRLPYSQSLVVHAGLPNRGSKRILEIISRYDISLFRDMPLGVSVAKTNSPAAVSDEAAIADYCESIGRLRDQAICQFIEINISCPNTYGGEPFTTPERLGRLLAAVDTLQVRKPIVIKMPINKPWAELRELLLVASEHSVDGITIGNLLHSRETVDSRDTLDESIRGNLSGAPTRAISTELIRCAYREFGDRFVIIGVGGVFSAEDAYEKIRAGASLVGMITGMIFKGPQVIGEINAGLMTLLKRDGFTSIQQAIGADHQKSV